MIVYVFLIALLRLTGKRQVGELAPFDLVLLLVLSNAVRNSMNGGDNSVVGGLSCAVGLVAVNRVVSCATHRNKSLARLVEGRPQVLMHNGHVYRDVMQRAKLMQSKLVAAIAAGGLRKCRGCAICGSGKQRPDHCPPEEPSNLRPFLVRLSGIFARGIL